MGIDVRHSRSCPRSRDKKRRCNCTPTYRARVWNDREGRREIRTFPTKAAAEGWVLDARQAVKAGSFTRPTSSTLRAAGDDLVAGMKTGSIRNRSGDPYKPSAVRSYERALRLRAYPTLGDRRLVEVRRRDIQDLIETMLGAGASASTIKNALDPLRVIYRRALNRDEVTIDPTHGLEVPADRGRRERFAENAETAKLLAALPEGDRALWATAFYTGLRRGELRELRCSDYDRSAYVLRVRRALDDDGTVIATKTHAGTRDVPVIPTLRPILAAHLLQTGRSDDDLIFGRTATAPFIPSTVRRRARDAWKAAKLMPITLHEARHSTATAMRAAGIDFKLISAILGHSSITITQDRYTHVSEAHLAEAAKQLEAHVNAS